MCFGIKCTESIINKIRKVPHVIAVFVLLLGLIPASVCPYSIHSIRLNYESEGFTNIEGMLWRCLFYIVAIVMGMAIINLLPATKLSAQKLVCVLFWYMVDQLFLRHQDMY